MEPKTKLITCPSCNGTGENIRKATCYICQGAGTIEGEDEPETKQEHSDDSDYRSGRHERDYDEDI